MVDEKVPVVRTGEVVRSLVVAAGLAVDVAQAERAASGLGEQSARASAQKTEAGIARRLRELG
ncbi:hypothetical protein SAMN06295885_0708 [Rathayibacter oskolensis]|uniref:Uncharacterized protein n=1 Tax=Rathayibacter oskolensis TaxID=1891671 RepID=A0A1X7N5M4_9MICO|nr:hypothetical protein [Rathayibacter oskolensis]SMH32209.1 hypothetical protein SAMN06295885_0708 [Rathayibacter oskolensis]